MAGAIIGTEGGPIGWLLDAAIGASIGATVSFFEALFGGSSDTPPTPRQLLHGRHPLYPVILGVPEGEIPDEVSAGMPQLSGDVQYSGTPPLSTSSPTPSPTQPQANQQTCEQNCLNSYKEVTIYACGVTGVVGGAGCCALACSQTEVAFVPCYKACARLVGIAIGACASATSVRYLQCKAACGQ